MIDLEALHSAWCRETASPTSACEARSVGDPRGQCAVTALLIQDLLGGDIMRAEVQDYTGTVFGSNYWNLIPGMGWIDMTRTQFADSFLMANAEVVQRARLLESAGAVAARTPERYRLLKERYAAARRARW